MNTKQSHNNSAPPMETILVVDDDSNNLFAMEAILEQKNRKIVTAQSGNAALEYLINHSVSLILMDVKMPGMSGFDTVLLIKQDMRHADVPILFTTGFYDTEEFIRYGFDTGAYDYIIKPVDSVMLRNKANVFIRLYRQQQELNFVNTELAKAARMKDEFLAAMSHELRTPLTSILGMSEVLQEQIFGDLNERQLKSLRIIEENGRHLLTLINDILDVSKIEAGKFDLKMNIVPLKSLCEACMRMIKQLAYKKRLKVSADFDIDVATFIADEVRVKQILVNLLNNAVKFTPENGSIGLEVKKDTESGQIHFTVWDTGIGIAKENIKQLFQPFVQLDSKLSRQYSGTGLGLALSYRLAKMHNGSLTLTSEQGKGSRFTVSLPLAVGRVSEA